MMEMALSTAWISALLTHPKLPQAHAVVSFPRLTATQMEHRIAQTNAPLIQTRSQLVSAAAVLGRLTEMGMEHLIVSMIAQMTKTRHLQDSVDVTLRISILIRTTSPIVMMNAC
jgi:hypothetical protein